MIFPQVHLAGISSSIILACRRWELAEKVQKADLDGKKYLLIFQNHPILKQKQRRGHHRHHHYHHRRRRRRRRRRRHHHHRHHRGGYLVVFKTYFRWKTGKRCLTHLMRSIRQSLSNSSVEIRVLSIWSPDGFPTDFFSEHPRDVKLPQRKLTCPLKRDHFKRKFHLPTILVFRGVVNLFQNAVNITS